MRQTFTSATTSINSTKLPAVYGKLPFKPVALLDYGCGKYTDHIRSGVGRQTGPDQWQRNEKLSAYLRFFPGAEIRKGMIIVKG